MPDRCNLSCIHAMATFKPVTEKVDTILDYPSMYNYMTTSWTWALMSPALDNNMTMHLHEHHVCVHGLQVWGVTECIFHALWARTLDSTSISRSSLQRNNMTELYFRIWSLQVCLQGCNYWATYNCTIHIKYMWPSMTKLCITRWQLIFS